MAKIQIKGSTPSPAAAGGNGAAGQPGQTGASAAAGESVSYVVATLATATEVDGATFIVTGGTGGAGGAGGLGGEAATGSAAGAGGAGGGGGVGGAALVRAADLATSGGPNLNIVLAAMAGSGGRSGNGGNGGFGGYTSAVERVTAKPAGAGGNASGGGDGGNATASLLRTTIAGGDLFVSVSSAAGMGGYGGTGGAGGAGAGGGGGQGGPGGAGGSATTEVIGNTFSGGYMRISASATPSDSGVLNSGGTGGQGGDGSILRTDGVATATPAGLGGAGGAGASARLVFAGNAVSASSRLMLLTMEFAVSAPTGGFAGYSPTAGRNGPPGAGGTGELRITDNSVTTSSTLGGVVSISLTAFKGAALTFENNTFSGSATARDSFSLSYASATIVSGDPVRVISVTADLSSGELQVDGRSNRLTNFDGFTVTGQLKVSLSGSDAVDSLTGEQFADVLDGRAGDDALSGRSGDDVLTGGRGFDFLDGGEGTDVGVYSGRRADYALIRGDYAGQYAIADLRADPQDGADRLSSVERLRFADGEVDTSSLATIAIDGRVASAISNVLRVPSTTLSALSAAATASIGLSSGALTLPGAFAIVASAGGGSTSVATLAYEFFTGRVPTAPGLDYLISSTANPNNLNSEYYSRFSAENRYINFAVNLGKLGEGQARFSAVYGALDLFAATRTAYTTIFGSTPTDAKLHQILDATSPTVFGQITRADYFAAYGGDGLNGIGTKAAMVGWLLAEAQKADVGVYAKANDLLLIDLADGATLGVDMVGVYGRPEHVYTGA